MNIITPHTRNAGYFKNNENRKNPDEADVQCCKHCETVILMQKWRDDGGFCSRCMAPVCGPCADRMLTYGCEPALKRIEAAFDMTIKYSQFKKMAGLDDRPTNFVRAIMVGGGIR